MRYKVLTVRDRAADVYGQPFFTQSTGVGVRIFTDEINRNSPDNNLFKHPEDFDLFYLGEFDDNTGEFDSCRPQQVAVGKDVSVKV